MQKYFFPLFHNYTDLENRTAISNFGPATGFKSQCPTRHAIYPYIFYPLTAHLKNSLSVAIFQDLFICILTSKNVPTLLLRQNLVEKPVHWRDSVAHLLQDTITSFIFE